MSLTCDPNEIALKSFFLGPQAENSPWVRETLCAVLDQWFEWRKSVFPGDGRAISDADRQTPEFLQRQRRIRELLENFTRRFEDEMPKFSPRYIGHMVSEISLPALFGHVLTLLHNPNNVSGDSSRVGVRFEAEGIAALARMVGMDPAGASGHFTSGGTIANFESLIRARERLARWLALGALENSSARWNWSLFAAGQMGWSHWNQSSQRAESAQVEAFDFTRGSPWEKASAISKAFGADFRGPVVLVPGHAHYSWKKGVALLGLGSDALWEIALDRSGTMSISDLRKKIDLAQKQMRPIMMVVSVAGSTEHANLDPVDEVQGLLEELRIERGLHVWHHVDAAYGGFFCSLKDLESAPITDGMRRALSAIASANSVTLDPHKLGYVPYSSGAFLCRSRQEYELPKTDAPYLEFKTGDGQGHVTLEGSRSAAGAVATCLTSMSIGLGADGYGRILARTIQARRHLEELLAPHSSEIRFAPTSQTNLTLFCLPRAGEKTSETNARTQVVYDAFSPQKHGPYYVSKTDLDCGVYREFVSDFVKSWDGQIDSKSLKMIRVCLMNPFFTSKETQVDFAADFVAEIRKVLARPLL